MKHGVYSTSACQGIEILVPQTDWRVWLWCFCYAKVKLTGFVPMYHLYDFASLLQKYEHVTNQDKTWQK